MLSTASILIFVACHTRHMSHVPRLMSPLFLRKSPASARMSTTRRWRPFTATGGRQGCPRRGTRELAAVVASPATFRKTECRSCPLSHPTRQEGRLRHRLSSRSSSSRWRCQGRQHQPPLQVSSLEAGDQSQPGVLLLLLRRRLRLVLLVLVVLLWGKRRQQQRRRRQQQRRRRRQRRQ